MNKTITVYELLGLVKDEKEVPKKIIGKNGLGQKEKYIYNGFWYIHTFEKPDGEEDYYYMDRDINNLNDKVEIIEDNDKLENNFNYIYQSEDEKVNANFENIKTTLKDIVDHINKIEEKIDE